MQKKKKEKELKLSRKILLLLLFSFFKIITRFLGQNYFETSDNLIIKHCCKTKDTRVSRRISKGYSNHSPVIALTVSNTALRNKASTYLHRTKLSSYNSTCTLLNYLHTFVPAITEHQLGITFIRNVYDPFAESSHGERSIIKTCRMSRIVRGLVFFFLAQVWKLFCLYSNHGVILIQI